MSTNLGAEVIQNQTEGKVKQIVLMNNAGRKTLEVRRGSTLAELAAGLGLENPQRARAMNDLGEVLTADSPLTEDGTVNFLENVSGAGL